MSVSIVIATRNRKDELFVALESCLAMDISNLEIIVFDDASSDMTANEVSLLFPQVVLFRNERRRGHLELRNRGFKEAANEYVVFLDDDCYFTEPTILKRIVRVFEDDSRVGVVCLPMIEPSRPRNQMRREPDERELMGSFLGGASAFRRKAVLEAGGYRGNRSVIGGWCRDWDCHHLHHHM